MTTTAVAQRARVEQIMGLPIRIHLRGDQLTGDSRAGRITAVFTELRRVDTVLSTYRDSSDLSAWERGALRAVERAARHLSTLDGYGWRLNAGGDVLVHGPEDQPALQRCLSDR